MQRQFRFRRQICAQSFLHELLQKLSIESFIVIGLKLQAFQELIEITLILPTLPALDLSSGIGWTLKVLRMNAAVALSTQLEERPKHNTLLVSNFRLYKKYYSALEKWWFAVVWTIMILPPYHPYEDSTNHFKYANLRWLISIQKSFGCLVRWPLRIENSIFKSDTEKNPATNMLIEYLNSRILEETATDDCGEMFFSIESILASTHQTTTDSNGRAWNAVYLAAKQRLHISTTATAKQATILSCW